MRKATGVIIAATVSALFATACIADTTTTTTTTAPSVKCMGGNACKGQGACKTANNACKGMNTCKGQGMTMTNTATDCTNAGGTVAAS